MDIYKWDNLSQVEKKNVLQRPDSFSNNDIREKTLHIIHSVISGGDESLRQFTTQYDKVDLEIISVNPNEFEEAHQSIHAADLEAIQFAKKQITNLHVSQLSKNKAIETYPGIFCERQARPIERVGLYIPGGTAPLVSTLLMLAIPAQIAGCPLRALCTPVSRDGRINPNLLVAAKLCGIDRIFKIGGAQAIAAMAYGTQTVPKVDKIFGPGNPWVTQAKIIVSQDPNGAAIDMPAGPSEILVIADQYANPSYVAADLLSQAEHGCDSQVILICLTESFALSVQSEIALQKKNLTRKEIIDQALLNSRILVAKNVEEAIEISNWYAPEHLILQVENPEYYKASIQNAGAVFLGPWSAEAMGDYITGSNHVLPTNGYAKSYSGLTLADFMKYINFQTVTQRAINEVGIYAEKLAKMEGLTAHQQAITLRLNNLPLEMEPPARSSKLIRADLQNFIPYSSARDEAKEGKIWLNANELPWNDHEEILINRYPDKKPKKILEQLGSVYGINPESILLTRGSDDAIDLLIRLFCSAEKDAVMVFSPTFGMYQVAAQLQGAQIIDCPLEKQDGFNINFDKLIEKWSSEIKIIFICSPNNPTGNLIKQHDVLRICKRFLGKSIIVLDEAYIEFSDEKSLSSYVQNFDNLIILRTFSKAYGLAAARCGAVIAQSELIRHLVSIMPPYPISSFTLKAISSILSAENICKVKERIDCIKKQRQILQCNLQQLSFVKYIYPSQANFLLVQFEDASKVIQHCTRFGIIIRSMHDKLNLTNCTRITIGSPPENSLFLKTMQQLEKRITS